MRCFGCRVGWLDVVCCVWWLGWVMGWVLGLSVGWLGWVFLHLFWVGRFFPLSGWVVLLGLLILGVVLLLPPLLLRGASYLPLLWVALSSVGWWCFPSLPLGSGAFSRALWAVFFSGNQPHPKKEAEGSTIKRRRRPSSPTRMGGRGKQHH